jgi:LPXTG-site transpeptidase (sortase) family protein
VRRIPRSLFVKGLIGQFDTALEVCLKLSAFVNKHLDFSRFSQKHPSGSVIDIVSGDGEWMNPSKLPFRLFALIALTLVVFFAGQPAPVVQAQTSAPPQINKQFTPPSILPGDTSRLTITIYNPNAFKLTDAAWADNLIGVQPGIKIASVPNTSNTCGGTLTADAGATSLSLSGGTVPEQVESTPGSCTVGVDVTSITPGSLINTIPADGLNASGGGFELSNTTPASATLNVSTIQPPSLSKNFNLNTISVGETSTLTIKIANTDLTNSLTQTTLTDTLPDNVVLADPVSPLLSGCGSATLTAASGESSLTLNNATIAANGNCQIKVNVTSNVHGVYTNTIPAGAIQTHQGVTNASAASAPLNVQGVMIGKAFSPASFEAGSTSTLTITLTNRTNSPYTGVVLQDSMPGSVLNVVPDSADTNCDPTDGSSASLVMDTSTPPRWYRLENGEIPAASGSTPGTCRFSFKVTAPAGAASASYTNRIAAGALQTTQGASNLSEVTAGVSVTAITINVSKSFSPIKIEAGGKSLLTVTLQNPTSSDLHGVSVTDTLPTGLLAVTPETAATNCTSGTAASANGESSTVTLSGATLPKGASCTLTAYVTTASNSAGTTYVNTIPVGAVGTTEGVRNVVSVQRNLLTYTAGTGVTATKTFTPASIAVGGNSHLQLKFSAPLDHDLKSFTVTDPLPSGVLVSNSPAASSSGCGSGATLDAAAGSATIRLSGATISAGSTCTVNVDVTGTGSGTFRNTISPGDITNEQNQTILTDTYADLRVSNLTMSKSFYPPTVNPNGLSTLTITLQNTNTSALTDTSLTDSLPANVYVASDPYASTTCSGGKITASGQTIQMTDGTVPAQVDSVPGICTIQVNVQGRGSGSTEHNTVGFNQVSATITGTSTTINPVDEAKADLVIKNLSLSVVNSFDPLTVFGGSASTLSIQIINPNNAVLTGIKLTDTMPAHMMIANPPDFSTGTCGGTLTGTVGSNVIDFKGGFLAANKRCTLTLSVTMDVNGNLTNTIPAGGVTTFNGVSNSQPTQATLTNLPGASISKFFYPTTILADPDKFSTLTITIVNTGNVPLTGLGFIDTLPGTLPNGLFIAGGSDYPSAPAPVTTCGGTLTAGVGTQSIQLLGGSLGTTDATKTCTVTLPVASTKAGMYTNIIAENTLVTTEKATNITPASDTLTVSSAPQLQVSKTVTSTAPFHLGDTINYNIELKNNGNVTLTNVQATDAGTDATLGVCSPTAPATLTAGQSMNCAATHEVVQADVDAGTYSNTATGDSDQTDPVSDTAVVPINKLPGLSIKKTITSAGPYPLNSTLTYSIVLKNIGGVDLTNVAVSEAGANAVLGACDLTTPATLAMGASLTCSATHTVTQADIDAGSYANTAVGTSTETGDVSSTVTVPITQSPALSVFKQVTSNPPFALGSTINYEIAVVNTGNMTLTHVTVTDPGAEVTLGTCSPTAPATLAVKATMTCTATHKVTQANIDAGTFVNKAYADSDQTEPASGEVKATFTQIPNITLAKTGTLNKNVAGDPNRVDAGDTITYAFTVKNTGNVTLSNITINDTADGVTLSGGPISLIPGASDSTTFTGSYTLKQTDVDAGTYTNTATVTAKPPIGTNVTATDGDTQSLTAAPSLSLEKTGTLHIDTKGPADRVDVGDTITYAFTVTNTGNVTLTNVSVADKVGGVTISGGPITLAPGASDSATFTGTYALKLADLDAGTFTNTATATGKPPSGANVSADDDDTQTLPPAPAITLEKTGTLQPGSDDLASGGDKIVYAFTVVNTGNVTLTNISIDDTADGLTITGGPISLAPGVTDSTTFTGSYTLKQTDVDAGTYTNTATVTGKPPSGADVSDDDDDTQTLTPAPAIALEKTGTLHKDTVAPNGQTDAGDTITYTFKVTNTGNVTLTNIQMSDLMTDVVLTGNPGAGDPDIRLAPGASDSVTFSASYTLKQADIDAGTFKNTAKVTGTPPSGTDVFITDDDEQPLLRVPSIDLQKTGTIQMDKVAPNTRADAGDEVHYAFTIKNTGNVTLTNIRLNDSVAGVTLSGGPIASLAPGATDSTTFTGAYTLTQPDLDEGSFTNTATVTGTPPSGSDVTHTDDDTQEPVSVPLIGVAKRVVESPKKVSPGVWDVTFEILVKNYSNVTLSQIKVEDDLKAAFPEKDASFTLQSVTSTDLTLDPTYDGITHLELLTGDDVLGPGEQGKLQIVVRVTPADYGPFKNVAIASGIAPNETTATDQSQTGDNPDPDNDGDPTNNDESTLTDFGPNLFDPPFGIKVANLSGLPVIQWTLDWINDTNITAINVMIVDEIPLGTSFHDDGKPSGYDLPTGTLPPGTRNTGVACKDNSDVTTTTTCYFEGPTVEHPRGQVIWQGVLGPDLGITDPDEAVHDLQIVFATNVAEEANEVKNVAAANTDLNGDGDTTDPGEVSAATAQSVWQRPQALLPKTGFAAGVVTQLPLQPAEKAYDTSADLVLEIPSLGIQTAIVGVPLTQTGWDVSWLGPDAGYLQGTAFPTWDGNSVVTAHVYDANGKPGPFVNLKDLKWGDEILVHAYGSVYHYEVRVSRLVPPDDLSVLKHEDRAWLTLLTCENYNENDNTYRNRLAVQAVLVKVEGK